MDSNLRDFKIEGKTTSENERLNMLDNWFEISLRSNFKIFIGILLRPTVFTGLRNKIVFQSVLSTGFIKKIMSILGKKS